MLSAPARGNSNQALPLFLYHNALKIARQNLMFFLFFAHSPNLISSFVPHLGSLTKQCISLRLTFCQQFI